MHISYILRQPINRSGLWSRRHVPITCPPRARRMPIACPLSDNLKRVQCPCVCGQVPQCVVVCVVDWQCAHNHQPNYEVGRRGLLMQPASQCAVCCPAVLLCCAVQACMCCGRQAAGTSRSCTAPATALRTLTGAGWTPLPAHSLFPEQITSPASEAPGACHNIFPTPTPCLRSVLFLLTHSEWSPGCNSLPPPRRPTLSGLRWAPACLFPPAPPPPT